MSSGVASARKSSTPASAAIAAAVSLLSPVIITVLMPMRRSSAKRSLMPVLTMSLSSTMPSTREPSATASGVLPRRATSSAARSDSGGIAPPSASTCWRTASTAPLRSGSHRHPGCAAAGRSTPLMRVWAVKGTKSAPATRSVVGCRLRRASSTMLRPFGRLVGQRGQQRDARQPLLRHAGRREKGAGLAVAVRDGAGLVEQQHVDVARGFHRAARGGDHVGLHHAAHAGHADGREQAADGGRDQAHQQRDQRGERRPRCRRPSHRR